MSRRRGEFEHRTSIFEGAFRAWSHLGGQTPVDLEGKSAADLDPLDFPLINDQRLVAEKAKQAKNKKKKQQPESSSNDNKDNNLDENGQPRREWAYEPLPRVGLAHPFVQAILSPWLGPDADQDAIQLGLTTLRTWWQHRRKGESRSAVVALGTEKMQGVVEGYTRHFFNLAHCLIVNDHEAPPRSLQGKLGFDEKNTGNSKKGKKRVREQDTIEAAAMAFSNGGVGAGGGANGEAGLSPLERLQAAQARQLAEAGGVHTNPQIALPDAVVKGIEMKGRCVPGKVNLPGLVQQVSSAATQLAHRGIGANTGGINTSTRLNNVDPSKYGDPSVTPVVVVSPNQATGVNDIQFYMTINGITCAHCVKIVETVLKGCVGSRSPINGLLDAAADMELNIVLIKIENINDCRRIAHEAARNLSMVGYTAKARSVSVPSDMTLQNMYSMMERNIPNVSPLVGFQWNTECTCPDNNVLRQNCPRHSQFSPGIIDVFNKTEELIDGFAAGCNTRTGMPCTAGVHCYCKAGEEEVALPAEPQPQDSNGYMSYQQPIQDSAALSGEGDGGMRQRGRASMRMSIGGLGGLGRNFSLTSNTTFGRAMSGLSALSIDWENMEDFDINVDHSAGINNDIIDGQQQQQAQPNDDQKQSEGSSHGTASGGEYGDQDGPSRGPKVARRSSLRNPIVQNGSLNVSFNM